jgi:two-component system, sensor histidine kinase and response regulator
MQFVQQFLLDPLIRLYWAVRKLGLSPELDDYEKRKLAIFNLLNCFGLLNGIIIPFAGLFSDDQLPVFASLIAFSPALISGTVLYFTYRKRLESGRMIYFTLYPLITAFAYASNTDIGLELFFVGYAVLAVFLLRHLSNAIFSFCLSMLLYLCVFVIWNDYPVRLATLNPLFYIFIQVLSVNFIFISLYLFKTENNAYQLKLKNRNHELAEKNIEIESQKIEIASQLKQLEKQKQELEELDAVKNKLFSVIAHDLKTPMYALRNLFSNIQHQDLPGEEIKVMLPDVVTDLNYTTGLMENLLHWAKSQMQSNTTRPQPIDITALIREVMQLLRLQAEAKRVYLEQKVNTPVYIFADRDMVHLVLRNLISNAIKFTPENGSVILGAQPGDDFVEIFVQDTGTGMTEETLKKINTSHYFTTKGTANESGTGLGLMLCKEFLTRNGGKMFVESAEGKGSTFSFTLPAAA